MKVKQVLKAVQDILGQSPVIEPDQLIDELIKAGFRLEDIQSAFAFIYSVPEKLNNGTVSSEPYLHKRILTDYERIRLSKEARGFLKALVENQLLSAQEFERVVYEALSYDHTEITVSDIQSAFHLVVDDPMRIALVVGGTGTHSN